jgi:murein DD-endopeptidase MepM/ murein hydrolase activator NlpD
VAGNHVIVQGADAFALLAHLAPGTVSVTTGQAVRAGEVIGRVGHTGNSTALHFHPQLMDSADPVQANDVRCASPSTWCSVMEGGSGSRTASLADVNGSAACLKAHRSR